MNIISTKFAMIPATLMLAAGLMTTGVTQANAGHRDGRIVAGIIAGVAVAAILSHRHRKKRRKYYRKHHRYSAYGRLHRICYDYYGEPYRCYRPKYRRHHYRRHRYDW